MNRASPTLLEFMQYYIDHCPTERGETYELAKELGGMLIENCREVLDSAPVYKDVQHPHAPKTTIDERGNIKYEEVPRPAVRKLESYVKEMASGSKITEFGSKRQVQGDLQRIYRIIKQQHKMSKSSKLQIKSLYGEVYRTLAINDQLFKDERTKKQRPNGTGFFKARKETIPFLHLKKKEESGWEYNQRLTGVYLDCLEQAAKDGVTFENKNVLITGAGAGSIGAEILQGLIAGGARVLVTTSRYSREVTEYYQSMYTRQGSKRSSLIVVPFNQGIYSQNLTNIRLKTRRRGID
jgi:fatty acid synthase subunit alpha, fungi type